MSCIIFSKETDCKKVYKVPVEFRAWQEYYIEKYRYRLKITLNTKCYGNPERSLKNKTYEHAKE